MKKDVQRYFIEQQKQFNEMKKMMDKVNEEIEQGLVSQEQRQNFEIYFNTIQSNYERIAYIVHLLNQPPMFIQKIQAKFTKKKLDKQLSDVTINENQEALDNIDKELEDVKE